MKYILLMMITFNVNAEYLLSGSDEDTAVDLATVCSIAGGSHQFNTQSKYLQVSVATSRMGGQHCWSSGLGKKIADNLFASLSYTYPRGDYNFTGQITYEFR